MNAAWMLMLAAGACHAQTIRRALVIGNADYGAMPALPACTASAHVLGAALRRAGFATTEKINVSNGEMGSAIGAFAGAGASALVLYVCGYAADYQNRVFLLPASAVIERDTDVLTQGLTASSLVRTVERAGAPAALVLFDAVDKPGSAVHFDTLSAAAGGPVGLAATAGGAPPPQGATRMAAAAAAALAGPDLEVGAVLRAVSARLGGPGPGLTMAMPAAPLALSGAAASAPTAQAPANAPVQAGPVQPGPMQAGPAQPGVATPDEAHMNEADRRRIQGALLRLGYYARQVDGVFGADTRAAIRRFQHEIGADMTGIIMPEQSARLLAGSQGGRHQE